MAKTIKPSDLDKALAKELTLYNKNIIERVNNAGETAVKKLVEKTKATAPKLTGDYRKRITSSAVPGAGGSNRYVWHVKAPDHRVTHLIVHGHAKKNGGRTRGNPFLKNAVDEVLPQYENAVEEAIKK